MAGRIVPLVALLLLAEHSYAGLVGSFNFDDRKLTPSKVAAKLTFSNFGYSGSDSSPSFVGSGAATAFSASKWSTGQTGNFNFTIAVKPGYLLDIDNIVFSEKRSANGPRAADVMIGRSNLESFTIPDDTHMRTQTADKNVASFSDLFGSIVVRMYGMNPEAPGGKWQLDNIQVNGTVSAVPEPSAILLIGLVSCGVAGWSVVRSRARHVRGANGGIH